MRSLNLIVLFTIGLVLAAGNLWYAASRSLIPWALDNRVERTELRWEKHPGLDDVHLIWLDNGRELQVDANISTALTEGVRVQKAAWSRAIQVDGHTVPLEWSADFWGMVKCMPLVLVVMAVTGQLLGTSRGVVRRGATDGDGGGS